MSDKKLSGFNTTLQSVDKNYSWINDMISQRQELVVMYMKLLNLPLHKEMNELEYIPSYEQITSFCDHLIDYVSHGHFDLFPKILELMENASGRSLSIAQRVMPRIQDTTEYLMRFNDKYTIDMNESKLKSLKKDLSQVGRCLEIRFKNEDRLIIGLRLINTIVSSK